MVLFIEVYLVCLNFNKKLTLINSNEQFENAMINLAIIQYICITNELLQ